MIYIVKKHKFFSSCLYGSGFTKEFTIHSTHSTRKEAKKEADLKNEKTKDYLYLVGKVQLKEQSNGKCE